MIDEEKRKERQGIKSIYAEGSPTVAAQNKMNSFTGANAAYDTTRGAMKDFSSRVGNVVDKATTLTGGKLVQRGINAAQNRFATDAARNNAAVAGVRLANADKNNEMMREGSVPRFNLPTPGVKPPQRQGLSPQDSAAQLAGPAPAGVTRKIEQNQQMGNFFTNDTYPDGRNVKTIIRDPRAMQAAAGPKPQQAEVVQPQPLPEQQPAFATKPAARQGLNPSSMAGTEVVNGNVTQRFGQGGRVETYVPFPNAPSLANGFGGSKTPQQLLAETELYKQQVGGYESLNGKIPLDQAQARFQNVQADELPGENRSQAGLRAAQARYYDDNAGLAERKISATEDRNRIMAEKNQLDVFHKIEDPIEKANYALLNYDPEGPPSDMQNFGKAAVQQQSQALNKYFKDNSGLFESDPTLDIISQFFPRDLPPASAKAIFDNIQDEGLKKKLGKALFKQYNE